MTTNSRKAASPAWGHGRNLLMRAARDLFAAEGYESVTTRQIAERAGVSEQMIFRHFGSKANLFEAAAVAPFVEHLDEYVKVWGERPSGVRDPVQEASDLYRGLYDVFAENRALLAALVSTQEPRSGSEDAVSAALAPALDRFAELLDVERRQRGFRDFDTRILVRLVAGLVISQTVFADLLYPAAVGGRPSVNALIHEMAMLTIHGAWPADRDR